MKNIEEMIIREKDKLNKLYERICKTSPLEKDKLKRLNNQYEQLRYYIMGLETALVYVKQERGEL